MIKIKYWTPQGRFLRYYIDSYFFLHSEGKESIKEENDGIFLYFKKNSLVINKEDTVLINSFYTENKISLEIHENSLKQRNYNGAVTEIILKLNKRNTHSIFKNRDIHELPLFIENFQLLYPNMNQIVDTLFCHRVSCKEKVKYLDEILMQYLTFAQLNGIENILKKNRIKYAS